MVAIDFPATPVLDDEFVAGGITYIFNGQGWTTQGGGGGATGDFVLKAGDTMTGDLTIAKSQPILFLDSTDPAKIAQIVASRNGLYRWYVHLGDQAPESSGNAGSNFKIVPADDTGIQRPPALDINRASSEVTLTGNLTIAPPSEAILLLDKRSATNSSHVSGLSGGKLRWALRLGDPTPETGGNAGSNFVIQRYDDNGSPLSPGNMLTIERATARVRIGSQLWFDDNSTPSYGSIYCTTTSWNFSSAYAQSTGQYMVPGGAAWIAFSDARLPWKVSATPVDDTLSKIADVQLYTNVNPESGKQEVFFKAQELALAFPEVVDEPSGPQARDASYVPEKLGDENAWGVAYDRCGAVALQAIKELLALNQALEARIAALEGATR